MSTKAIEGFLRTAYSDEKLAALLAWTEDGGLSALSCCCLVGIPTRVGAFNKRLEFGAFHSEEIDSHYLIAQSIPGATEAEWEFIRLGDDEERRTAIIPLIRAEMARRDALNTPEAGRGELARNHREFCAS